jgi:hypothetical protein
MSLKDCSGHCPSTIAETSVVFVVDPDASLRDALDPLIRAAGWQPRAAASAEEFLALPRGRRRSGHLRDHGESASGKPDAQDAGALLRGAGEDGGEAWPRHAGGYDAFNVHLPVDRVGARGRCGAIAAYARGLIRPPRATAAHPVHRGDRAARRQEYNARRASNEDLKRRAFLVARGVWPTMIPRRIAEQVQHHDWFAVAIDLRCEAWQREFLIAYVSEEGRKPEYRRSFRRVAPADVQQAALIACGDRRVEPGDLAHITGSINDECSLGPPPERVGAAAPELRNEADSLLALQLRVTDLETTITNLAPTNPASLAKLRAIVQEQAP